MRQVVVEPRPGGLWYEIGEDGSKCVWGDVLAWEPPQRLVLAWRIGADWKFDAALLTEVEATFTPVSDDRTRVDVEHRDLQRLGDRAAGFAEIMSSEKGWSLVLSGYAASFGGAVVHRE